MTNPNQPFVILVITALHLVSLLTVDFFYHSVLFHDFSHGFSFLSPFLFYLFLLFSCCSCCVCQSRYSSMSVQAAKLQWSLDEKVGSSRGTRVSRPFVHFFVSLCWCVTLLSGLTLCCIKLL